MAPDSPKILIAPGPRAAEQVILAAVEAALVPPGDLAGLASPVRVVVPSRSLRLHLATELVRRIGRPLLGVRVQTLHQLALEILAAAGEPPPAGAALFPLLVRRAARREAALASGLETLVDGYGAVTGTVRDLLDAAFDPALSDGLDEALAEDGRKIAPDAEVARAQALVRVAARVYDRFEHSGLGRGSTLFRRASDLLAGDPDLIAARALLIHGFGDAPGVQIDLLEGLLRRPEARLVLDRPPRPTAATARLPSPEASDSASARQPELPFGAAGGDGAAPAPALESGFTERFLDRLALDLGVTPRPLATGDVAEGLAGAQPAPTAFTAAGTEAEVREAARRVRRLLDAGARPEGIAIVARDLAPFLSSLRRHLERLAIPWTGAGSAPGPLLPAGRRVRSFVELLRQGREAPVDRWLDAVRSFGDTEGGAGRATPDATTLLELRLGFHAQGAGRVGEAAALDTRRFRAHGLPLPIRLGFTEPRVGGDGAEGAGDEDALDSDAESERRAAPGGLARRRLAVEDLERAVAAAGRLAERLAAWPESAPFAAHEERLRSLATDELGWRRPGADDDDAAGLTNPGAIFFPALAALARDVPADFALARDELVLLLEAGLAEREGERLGGLGGGVAVLDALAARGRTFDHLYLLGMNDDLFPRAVPEDPLLPDDLREVLRRVLPDLPVKLWGHREERHLFAQLLAAAPAVTLSWQTVSDDGAPRPVSTLVARLGWEEEGRGPTIARARPLHAPPAPGEPLRAREHAVVAALAGGRQALAGRLDQALLERPALMPLLERPALMPLLERPALMPLLERPVSRPLVERPIPTPLADPDPEPARALARAHLAILDEIDPPAGRPGPPGPYFGFVGASRPGDPRSAAPWVTALEGLAACPWQTFLTRVLRLEPTPDPLAALPGLPPFLVGSVVHAVLEEVARRAGAAAGEPLAALAGRPGVEVAWPSDEREIERLLRSRAAILLDREGIGFPGLARALARAARPFLDVARGLERAEGGSPVLGVEADGEIAVAGPDGAPRRLRFRVDRVDLDEAGGPRLTDFKTGRPVSEAKTDKTRRAHLLRAVADGGRLQVAAYARAAGALSAAGTFNAAGALSAEGGGRYLFLRPDLPEELREAGIATADTPFDDAFTSAVATLLAAWDAGAFFPRLAQPDQDKEPRRCQWCEVSEACLRGDSGARLRLRGWSARAHRDDAGDETAEPTVEGAAAAAFSALLGVWRLPAKEQR